MHFSHQRSLKVPVTDTTWQTGGTWEGLYRQKNSQRLAQPGASMNLNPPTQSLSLFFCQPCRSSLKLPGLSTARKIFRDNHQGSGFITPSTDLLVWVIPAWHSVPWQMLTCLLCLMLSWIHWPGGIWLPPEFSLQPTLYFQSRLKKTKRCWYALPRVYC